MAKWKIKSEMLRFKNLSGWSKNYSFLVDNKERKKANGMKRNIVATISHNEYKNALLNNKRTRHSINRI